MAPSKPRSLSSSRACGRKTLQRRRPVKQKRPAGNCNFQRVVPAKGRNLALAVRFKAGKHRKGQVTLYGKNGIRG
nr:MAG TPA: hypothetical protein [Caudoviricetes sp.]